MKSLLLKEYGSLAIADVAQPEPGEREVLVRVAACGICGSECMATMVPPDAAFRRW